MSQEEIKQQNEPVSESNDKPLRVGNHVRFSVAHHSNEPVVDDLDMASLSSKAFAILGETLQPPDITNVNQSTENKVGESIDNNSENGEEQKRKKQELQDQRRAQQEEGLEKNPKKKLDRDVIMLS